MLIASGITLGLAIIVVALRLVVRLFVIPPVSLEDYFSFAALVLAIGRTVMLILSKPLAHSSLTGC